MSEVILNDLKVVSEQLMQALSFFSQEQLNVSPPDNGWTAGQVADHLSKANGGVLPILYGKTEKSIRRADEKVTQIKNLFLNFSVKFKSAPQIMPSDGVVEKKIILHELKTKLAALYEAARILDLSEICLDVEVPVLGMLTRLEWLYLVCYHTERHIHQITNIFEKTVENKYILS